MDYTHKELSNMEIEKRDMKLILVDMDGTFLNHDLSVCVENMEVWEKVANSDTIIIPCTGRGRFKVNSIIQDVIKEKGNKIKQMFPKFSSLKGGIYANGLDILHHETGECLCEGYLPESTIKAAYEFAHKNNLGLFAYKHDDVSNPANHTHTQEGIHKLAQYQEMWDSTHVDILYDKNLKLKKLYFFFEHKSQSQVVDLYYKSDLPNLGSMTCSVPEFIEYLPLGTSKGAAAQKLTQALDINMDDVLGIGDSFNDIEMLKTVGVSVAMGNAHDEIKDIAKYVTKSNMEAGVAYAIDKLCDFSD